MEFEALWIPGAIFAGAGLVQGLSGFGSGMVAMALLPLLWEVRLAVAVSVVFSLAINAALTYGLRSHLSWREIRVIVLTALAGVPLGVWVLTSQSAVLLQGLLGVVLVTQALWNLVGRSRVREAPWPWAAAAGVTSGALGGAFNTAGPPLLVYASWRGWERDAFRANLQAAFLVTGVAATMGMVGTGIVTAESLTVNLVLCPAIVAGTWVGYRLGFLVNPALFRRGVQVVLLGLGATYVWAMVSG